MSDNVRIFKPHGIAARQPEQLTFEQFCIADASEQWISRTQLENGMIVLVYPRCTMICAPDGSCMTTKIYGSDMERYLSEACACLDDRLVSNA